MFPRDLNQSIYIGKQIVGNMELDILYFILLQLIGIFILITSIRFLVNPEFAKKYVETSHKAALWRMMFGVKGAMKAIKYFFAPLMIIVGIASILLGIVLLWLGILV